MRDEKYRKSMDLGNELLSQLEDSLNEVDLEGLSETIRSSIDYIREEAARGYATYKKYSAQEQVKGYAERYKKNHNIGIGTEKKASAKPLAPIIKDIPGKVQGSMEAGLGIAALIICGGTSLALGGYAAVASLLTGAASAGALHALGGFLPFTAVGAALIAHGKSIKDRAKRLLGYNRIFRGRDYIMIEDLARESGQDVKKIKKDLDYVYNKGLAPMLTVDQQETCILLTNEARAQYEQAELARLEREKEERRAREEQERLEKKRLEGSKEEREWYRFQEENQRFLQNLSQKKQEIESETMLAHLDNIELLLSQIYICIQEHPEMIFSTGHLISYYLPCMSKLINTYEDLEDQPIQGDNILKTKQEIEHSFGTIEEALETMYDELFRNVSMDISSDIQVLKAMMAQDGWSENPMTPSELEL